jgi:hypothetical protein
MLSQCILPKCDKEQDFVITVLSDRDSDHRQNLTTISKMQIKSYDQPNIAKQKDI